MKIPLFVTFNLSQSPESPECIVSSGMEAWMCLLKGRALHCPKNVFEFLLLWDHEDCQNYDGAIAWMRRSLVKSWDLQTSIALGVIDIV